MYFMWCERVCAHSSAAYLCSADEYIDAGKHTYKTHIRKNRG